MFYKEVELKMATSNIQFAIFINAKEVYNKDIEMFKLCNNKNLLNLQWYQYLTFINQINSLNCVEEDHIFKRVFLTCEEVRNKE